MQSVILSGSTTKLSVPKPRCAELAALIEQLEQLPAPDRFRRISHLLVDAGAHDFVCVDPEPDDTTPLSIAFAVDTARLSGRVTILYDYGMDLYVIELRRDGELIERVEEISFDMLGEALERRIDDGCWRQVRVDVLPSRSRSTTTD